MSVEKVDRLESSMWTSLEEEFMSFVIVVQKIIFMDWKRWSLHRIYESSGSEIQTVVCYTGIP